MLEYLKNYYVFVLVLMVFSYLVPKEKYKVYIQFFVGIFVVVLFLKPVLEVLTMNTPTFVYDFFEQFNNQLEQYEIEMEESENIYEYFFFERERE